MKIVRNFIGGLAGAVALNLLHEGFKRLDKDAPRVDLIGEQSVTKGLKALGVSPPTGHDLYATTLAADVISNALYYSLIGGGKRKHIILRGIGYGAAAGIGALKLTKPLGLNDKPVTRTDKTKALTVAWYITGGIVAALTIRALGK